MITLKSIKMIAASALFVTTAASTASAHMVLDCQRSDMTVSNYIDANLANIVHTQNSSFIIDGVTGRTDSIVNRDTGERIHNASVRQVSGRYEMRFDVDALAGSANFRHTYNPRNGVYTQRLTSIQGYRLSSATGTCVERPHQ